jgi:maltooligosyltrehalose trehalohydrolase
MGEEYGEENPFQYFVSFGDPELIENIRQGRKREFAGFIKGHEVPDPQCEKTFARSNLSWNCQSGARQVLLNFYRRLIAFRKIRPAMQNTSRSGFRVHRCTDGLLCIQRTLASDSIYIYLNFGDCPLSLPNDTIGTLYKVLDSASMKWGGPCNGKEPKIPVGSDIHLSPHSCTVFETGSFVTH